MHRTKSFLTVRCIMSYTVLFELRRLFAHETVQFKKIVSLRIYSAEIQRIC
jgi:hypothetical protein